jgi:hypothetical protein
MKSRPSSSAFVLKDLLNVNGYLQVFTPRQSDLFGSGCSISLLTMTIKVWRLSDRTLASAVLGSLKYLTQVRLRHEQWLFTQQ